MAKVKVLMFDIDNTVLSFDKAEVAAFRTLFRAFGFGEFTAEHLVRYHAINRRYWAEIEQGTIEKSKALVRRFEEYFDLEQLDRSRAEEFNRCYQLALGDTIAFCDNANELLERLRPDYTLVAVTNGTKLTQDKKLRLSKLDQIFDSVFISEEVGYEKPDVRFFEYVRQHLALEDFSDCLLIGDTLNSDIKGGNNANIRTIWYNPKGVGNTSDAKPDVEIRDLNEILDYL